MLALVAGCGKLPSQVVRALPERPLICAVEGVALDALSADFTFRLEQLGSLFAELETRGINQVCFCGAMERPHFDPQALDDATRTLAPRLEKALGAGDDAALRVVISLFEERGMKVRAVQDLLPSLLIDAGEKTNVPVNARMIEDIARADAVLAALAPLDVGQACVVGSGQIWGIETIGGTDHMLHSLPPAVRKANALLVKKPKAGQDKRVDVPVVGPETIDAIVSAGLSGLVVSAGEVMVVAADDTVARARQAGLVFWARPNP